MFIFIWWKYRYTNRRNGIPWTGIISPLFLCLLYGRIYIDINQIFRFFLCFIVYRESVVNICYDWWNCWIKLFSYICNNRINQKLWGDRDFSEYFGKWHISSAWEFFIDKRIIMGKLLYVLIALILMLLSVFLFITILKTSIQCHIFISVYLDHWSLTYQWFFLYVPPPLFLFEILLCCDPIPHK